MIDSTLLHPRRCLLEPIREIWSAANLLREAVDAHSSGLTQRAEALIVEADIPAIANWTESVWGARDENIHRYRLVPNSPPCLPRDKRPMPRMPTADTLAQVRQRDGFFCRFCRIPVVESSLRRRIHAAYPNALRWGRKNAEQHSAFQCMWLQYDHVVPNSRGGESSFDNVIVTCAPCNFGRMEWTLEEVGLIDPRLAPSTPSWDGAATWNGLEQFC